MAMNKKAVSHGMAIYLLINVENEIKVLSGDGYASTQLSKALLRMGLVDSEIVTYQDLLKIRDYLLTQ